MPVLTARPLMVLRLDVDFSRIALVGETPHGQRQIAPVTGGTFEGDRLSGRVRPGGADWVRHRPDGVMEIDVRLTLETGDGALIYLSYQGRFLAAAEVMKRFRRGEQLDPNDYSLAVLARFECGAPGYAWLNDTLSAGIGEQLPTGVVYAFHAIG